MQHISEFQIQRALCGWLDGWGGKYPPALRSDAIYFHVPNGGARSAIEGARFKEIGVKPGVFDLMFLHRSLWFVLELKDDKGKLSPDQLRMWKRYEAAGGADRIAWANNLDAAKNQCIRWGLIVDNMHERR